MSGIGDQIAVEALTWVGTPFRWHQRVKGLGVDCKGLLAGVSSACGRVEGTSAEALAGDYEKKVDELRLRSGLRKNFDLVDRANVACGSMPPVSGGEIMPGDVLLLKLGGKAQHLAIAIGDGTMVHCMAGGPGQVVHVPVPAHRLDSVWRWRELEGDVP